MSLLQIAQGIKVTQKVYSIIQGDEDSGARLVRISTKKIWYMGEECYVVLMSPVD